MRGDQHDAVGGVEVGCEPVTCQQLYGMFPRLMDVQVQLIAVQVEVFLHSRDVGIVDVLLIEVFDHCIVSLYVE